MNIVCASSVLHAAEAFSRHGEVTLRDDAEITSADLVNAQALITRTKTTISHDLIAGSALSFYGTATAGTDHIDLAAMTKLGVHVADAGGCNANAVAEYVVAALYHFEDAYGLALTDATIGIVGHGHVGKQVAAKARTLGMNVLLNDPPLEDAGGSGYAPLDQLIQKADVLSLHVPLIEEGPHPTRALLNATNLANLPAKPFLINACRGEVITNEVLTDNRFRAMILDVWDPEPAYPAATFEKVDAGSPHVAGHSVEGKLYGTSIIYEKFCQHFGLTANWDEQVHLPMVGDPLDLSALDHRAALRRAVGACVNFTEDHRIMSEALEAGDHAAAFTARRRNYPLRREFPATQILTTGLAPETRELLAALGFTLIPTT